LNIQPPGKEEHVRWSTARSPNIQPAASRERRVISARLRRRRIESPRLPADCRRRLPLRRGGNRMISREQRQTGEDLPPARSIAGPSPPLHQRSAVIVSRVRAEGRRCGGCLVPKNIEGQSAFDAHSRREREPPLFPLVAETKEERSLGAGERRNGPR